MEKAQPIWKDYRLHVMVLIFSVIAEVIGSQSVKVGRFSFTLAPLIFSMVLMTVFYLIPNKKLLQKRVQIMHQR